jgi:CubicO group peptidase (beta-lactamase class C family)
MKRHSIGFWGVVLYCTSFVLFHSPDELAGHEFDFRDFDKFVEKELADARCPGASVAIVLGEQVIYAKGYGLANVESAVPVTTDMLFRMGSTTKMLTAAALLKLVESGDIDLHKPIGEVVSNLDSSIAKLTPHQLLTHTSGLSDPNAMDGPHDESALEGRITRLSEEDFFEVPNSIYSYSNAGYWTAGLVIQKASRQRYADFLTDSLFGPLHMKQATFRPTVAMTWPLAVGHGPEDRSPARVIRPLSDNAETWPAGQLFCTAPEFARFLIAFMNDGIIDDRQVLSKFIIDEMSKPHAAIPNENRHYGYGLSIRDTEGIRWLSHTGSRTGYGSYVLMCPDKKFAFVVLANKTGVMLTDVGSFATYVVLGIQRPQKSKPNETRLSTEEMEKYSGDYANGRIKFVLNVKDNSLYGSKNRPVFKIGERQFVAHASNDAPLLRFTSILDNEGNVKYLMINSRAYKRQ